jgi:hypothetical protein
MLDISVAKVSLQRPCVVPFVGQRIPAGVPQHVRVRFERQGKALQHKLLLALK